MNQDPKQLLAKFKKALDKTPSKEKLEVLNAVSNNLKKMIQAVKDVKQVKQLRK